MMPLAIPDLVHRHMPRREDWTCPWTLRRWFIIVQSRRGGVVLAEQIWFSTEAEAEARRCELRQADPSREPSVVSCRVTGSLRPLDRDRRLQFDEYNPANISNSARGRIERFCKLTLLRQSASILWYGGEFMALMNIGELSIETAAEDKVLRDRYMLGLAQEDGVPAPRSDGQVERLQQDCDLRVRAYLLHQAVEVGMKTLLACAGLGPAELRRPRHRLSNVWALVDESHRVAVNRIFDAEFRKCPPGLPSFDDLVTAYSRGKLGIAKDLRYLGDEPWAPLADEDLAHHLWKMGLALLLYYVSERDLWGWAQTTYGILTDFRKSLCEGGPST